MKKYFLLTLILALSALITESSSQWTNGQNALNVIGQPNFTSNVGATTQNGIGYPDLFSWWAGTSPAIDTINGKMYISDLSANRVLRYNWPITGNQPNADLVFGQPDFTSYQQNRGGSVAANTLAKPTGLAVSSNGTLWIADAENNRVLKFNNAHQLSSNGPNADVVLGQPNMTSNTEATSQSGLKNPRGIAFDGNGNLWVADNRNHRVLKFNNAASKSNGANADGVLGQSDFTSNTQTTTQNGMSYPSSVAFSGTSLFVADFDNNRVLRFDNAASKSNGANADGVLGQSDFVSKIVGISQSKMSGLNGLAVDANGRLYVADYVGNRVLIFNNATSKSNGANADFVLGQSNFTNFTSGTAQNKLNFPSGFSVDNLLGCILVHDSFNNRVLLFQSDVSFTAGSGFPTTQASNITPSEVRSTSMGLTWNKGNGSGSFLVVKANNPLDISDVPVYGTSYSSYNTNFSSAPSIGNAKICYYGTGNSISLSGLTALTWYYIKAFGYNGDPSNGTAKYNYGNATKNPLKQRAARFREVETDETFSLNQGFSIGAVNPNPAIDRIGFSIFAEETEPFEIEIYDLNGRIVYSNTFSNVIIGDNKVDISLDGLTSGNYTLVVKQFSDMAVYNFIVVK